MSHPGEPQTVHHQFCRERGVESDESELYALIFNKATKTEVSVGEGVRWWSGVNEATRKAVECLMDDSSNPVG